MHNLGVSVHFFELLSLFLSFNDNFSAVCLFASLPGATFRCVPIGTALVFQSGGSQTHGDTSAPIQANYRQLSLLAACAHCCYSALKSPYQYSFELCH